MLTKMILEDDPVLETGYDGSDEARIERVVQMMKEEGLTPEHLDSGKLLMTYLDPRYGDIGTLFRPSAHVSTQEYMWIMPNKETADFFNGHYADLVRALEALYA